MKHKLQLASIEEREGWQGQYEEECRVWAKEHQPAITALKAKLFAIAGDKYLPNRVTLFRDHQLWSAH